MSTAVFAIGIAILLLAIVGIYFFMDKKNK